MSIIKYLFRKEHYIITALTGLIVLILSIVTFKLPAFDPLAKALKNISVTDLFFSLENKYCDPDTCKSIVLVDMTELHNRGDLGNMLSEIGDAHPKAIGIDLIFEGEKDDIEGNLILEQAVEKIAPYTVFAKKLTDYDPNKKSFTGMTFSYFSTMIPITEGYANITDNLEKSTIRELTITQNTALGTQYSLTAGVAKKIGYKHHGSQKIVINYRPVHFECIPFDKIKENSALIKDKIVLVGTMKEEQDTHLTPLGKLPGLEIQAYSLLSLLEHKRISYTSSATSITIAILMSLLYELVLGAMALFIASRRERLRIFLTESCLLSNLVSMTYVSGISLLSYAIFYWEGIYIDMVTVLIWVAFVGLSRRLYFATKKSLLAPPQDKTDVNKKQ